MIVGGYVQTLCFYFLRCNGSHFFFMAFSNFKMYPEEGRPCLSKYWKIYFPDGEISLTPICFICSTICGSLDPLLRDPVP